MKKQSFLAQVRDAVLQGENAIIVEGNVDDRFVDLEDGIPPMRLAHALAAEFGKRGFHVARLSCAGLQELSAGL